MTVKLVKLPIEKRTNGDTALLCSPSREDSKDLSSFLRIMNIRVVSASDIDHAVRLTKRDSFALILVNLDRDQHWQSTLKTLQAQVPEAGLLAYSDRFGIRRWLDALEAGARDFVCKPFRWREIRSIVRNALQARSKRTGPRESVSQLRAA